MERASLSRRFFASFIDAIVLSLLNGVMTSLSGDAQMPGALRSLWDILSLVISALYYIWPYSTSGQTLGKRALGIKVVSVDGSPLTWRKGIMRSVGYFLSDLSLGLGYLCALWDRNKQAGHDKIAGTYVVPASFDGAQLLDTVVASEVRRTQRRWLIGLAIPSMLVVTWFAVSIWQGVAEVNAMEPWPSPEVAPEDVVRVDLSHLGLRAGEIQDAHADPSWADGGYDEGVFIPYGVGAEAVVGIWALRYQTEWAAGNDYSSVQAWAQDNCGQLVTAELGSTGVIRCQLNNGYDKIFWQGEWIVDVTALEGSQFSPDVLVDQVRDALVAHWHTLARAVV